VTWLQNVGEFLPSTAGTRMYAYHSAEIDAAAQQVQPPGSITLEPWQGLLVLLAWVIVLSVIGAILMRRRDV
jgi:ABC-2 type transport system permease protein